MDVRHEDRLSERATLYVMGGGELRHPVSHVRGSGIHLTALFGPTLAELG